MDNDRVKHSISVARRMVEIGKSYNLSNEELEELFVLGLNHDIGYEFCDGRNHNVVGGNILKRSNYKYTNNINGSIKIIKTEGKINIVTLFIHNIKKLLKHLTPHLYTEIVEPQYGVQLRFEAYTP